MPTTSGFASTTPPSGARLTAARSPAPAQARRAARLANFRRDCWGLANDRLASSAYLAAHGLPTVPTLAIYRAGLAAPGASLLRTRDELRQFLEARAGAPLIARPSEGGPGRRLFGGTADPLAEIDRFIDATSDAGPVSWLFQTPLEPHPSRRRRRAASRRCAC